MIKKCSVCGFLNLLQELFFVTLNLIRNISKLYIIEEKSAYDYVSTCYSAK